MLSVKEVIVVEGRYDKNTLSQVVDAVILETEGFGIFHDAQKQKLLRTMAERRGLIILTDPDGAGFVIRNHIKSCVPKEFLKQAYVPDIYGKEKRKARPSREGKLGVEGMRAEVLLEALRRAGATFDEVGTSSRGERVTKADLYRLGLSGGEGSALKRAELIRAMDLPEHISATALLDLINALMNREAFFNFFSHLGEPTQSVQSEEGPAVSH